MSNNKKKQEDWMNSKWRPAMGWLYMGTCTFDFIIFPVIWSIMQAYLKQPITQWQPLTLQGAGLYHIAMGAVLGLAAFGRTQEKLAGVNVAGLTTTTSNSMYGGSTSTYVPSPYAQSPYAPTSFSPPASPYAPTSFAPPRPLAPMQPEHPER